MSSTPVYQAMLAAVGARGVVWLGNGEVLRVRLLDVTKGMAICDEITEVSTYTASTPTTKCAWPAATKTWIAIDQIVRFGRPPWA